MRRGFTLIELMVTISIMAILSTMAVASFSKMRGPMQLRSAAFQISAMAGLAKMRAPSTNVDNYLVFYEKADGTTFGVLLAQVSVPPTWATVNVANLPGTIGGNIIQDFQLSSSDDVSFYALTNFAGWLRAPFGALAGLSAPGGGGLMDACSFCSAATNGNIGAIRFAPDGPVTVATGANLNAAGATVGLFSTADQGTRRLLIAIAVPAGALRVLER